MEGDNVLQHTTTHCNTLQHTTTHCNKLQHTATIQTSDVLVPLLLKPDCVTHQVCAFCCCSMSQYVAVYVAVYCSMLQYVAMYWSVLSCVAVCCSVLQSVGVCCCVLHVKSALDTTHAYTTTHTHTHTLTHTYKHSPAHILSHSNSTHTPTSRHPLQYPHILAAV